MGEQLNIIKKYFKKSENTILAIGDSTRQMIIVTLLDGLHDGLRVGDIKEKTHLSRPAVSHHLKILKDANIVSIRKSGTRNFYFLNPNIEEIENVRILCTEIIKKMKEGKFNEKNS